MSICLNCGKENNPFASYCEKCSQSLSTIERLEEASEKWRIRKQQDIADGTEISFTKKGVKSFTEFAKKFTRKQRENIERLELDENEIENFEGMDLFPEILEISLVENKINDLSGFLEGRYEVIDLSYNQIREIPDSFYKIINSQVLGMAGLTISLKENPLQNENWTTKIDFAHIYTTWLNKPIRTNDYPRIFLSPIDANLLNLGAKISNQGDHAYLDTIAINKLLGLDQNTGKGKCYVATAVYGDYNHPIVYDLRLFRDNFLAKRTLGRSFIKWYYKIGPKYAEVIERSNLRKKMTLLILLKPLHFIINILKLNKPSQ